MLLQMMIAMNICTASELHAVSNALEDVFGEPQSSKLVWRPQTNVQINDRDVSKLLNFLEALDDNDDVQMVSANFYIADEIMERFTAYKAAIEMRIIGLDPGLRNTGWGIIDVQSNQLKYVADGTVRPCPKQSLGQRLSGLYSGLNDAIIDFEPNEAAVEETFLNKNPKSTLKLGEARGVVILAPALAGLSVAEYSANQIKKSVVGAGHAGKGQVQMMVKRILPGCQVFKC